MRGTSETAFHYDGMGRPTQMMVPASPARASVVVPQQYGMPSAVSAHEPPWAHAIWMKVWLPMTATGELRLMPVPSPTAPPLPTRTGGTRAQVRCNTTLIRSITPIHWLVGSPATLESSQKQWYARAPTPAPASARGVQAAGVVVPGRQLLEGVVAEHRSGGADPTERPSDSQLAVAIMACAAKAGSRLIPLVARQDSAPGRS